LGILAVIIPYLGLILGIIAIVFAKKSLDEIKKTQEAGYGMAIAGLVTGIVGTSLYGIVLIIIIFSLAVVSSFAL
jgi:uncharacterized membrane protein